MSFDKIIANPHKRSSHNMPALKAAKPSHLLNPSREVRALPTRDHDRSNCCMDAYYNCPSEIRLVLFTSVSFAQCVTHQHHPLDHSYRLWRQPLSTILILHLLCVFMRFLYNNTTSGIIRQLVYCKVFTPLPLDPCCLMSQSSGSILLHALQHLVPCSRLCNPH